MHDFDDFMLILGKIACVDGTPYMIKVLFFCPYCLGSWFKVPQSSYPERAKTTGGPVETNETKAQWVGEREKERET